MKTKAKYGHLIKWLLSAIDLLVLNVSYLGTAFCLGGKMGDNLRLVGLMLNLSYIIVIYFRRDIHDRRVMYADDVAIESFKSVSIHAAIFIALISFLSLNLPVKGFAVFYCVFALSLMLWWIIARKFIKKYRNKGFNYRNVIMVGDGAGAGRFMDEITGDMGYGYHVVGVFGCSDEFYPEIPHYRIDDLETFVINNEVDELYYSIPDGDSDKMSSYIRLSERCALDFYYIPQLGPTVTRNFSLMPFGNVPVMAVRPLPINNVVNRIFKRLFDIVVSTIVLVLFPLVLIPVAIAIKCNSRGPIFFKQERTGYRGKAFNCYKLRTMEVRNEDDSSAQVTRDDPHVTRVGRLLRHYSIDELPQFFNVLKGDMSIVGPRPHMVQHTELYSNLIDKYMMRHMVKPGITGWAQVLGYRGGTDELWKMEKRVECDVWYTENWNFMLDIKIIFLTVINVFKGEKNAY